jgi:hypothetical protein
MTFSRVDLRFPRRVVEAARAAQYANRETLAARTALQQVQRRVQQEIDAIRRVQPDLGRQAGGQLEFERPPPQRLWRRKGRRVRPVDVGVGFWSAAYAMTGSYPDFLSTERGALGSGNGLSWKYYEETWRDGGNEQPGGLVLLPAGSRFLAISFYYLYDRPAHNYSMTRVKGYEVTYEEVREITVPAGLRQAMTNAINADPNLAAVYQTVPRVWPSVDGYLKFDLFAISSTSTIYHFLANPPSAADFYGIAELEAEAGQRFGGEIPVLGIDFDVDPQPSGAQITYNINRYNSNLGVITGYQAGSTSPPVEPIDLRRIHRHESAPGAQAPDLSFSPTGGQLNYGLFSYDYHGGTYCEDQLRSLGFTL